MFHVNISKANGGRKYYKRKKEQKQSPPEGNGSLCIMAPGVTNAVTESKLKIEKDRSMNRLNLQIDESICSMYDYFEIFLGRMMLCRKSAEILGTIQ